MNSEQSLLGMLGLARRAGKLVLGQSGALAKVRDGTVHLVIVDGAAADNTRETMRNACRFHGVPLMELESSDLGVHVGRPAVRVAGVKDEKFAQQLQSKYGTGSEV